MNWISSKNKNFALGKTWLNKNTSHRLGKNIYNHISDKELTNRSHEELLKCNNKETTYLVGCRRSKQTLHQRKCVNGK